MRLAWIAVVALCINAALSDEEQNNGCRMTQLGKEYMGTLSTSKDGRTCQFWTDHPKYTDFPDASPADASNYCRNPDSSVEGPWCFVPTYDKQQLSWMYCSVPMCSSDCPSNFEYSAIANLCYAIVTQHHTWNDSHAVCKELHPDAKLLVLENVQQQAIVAGGIAALPEPEIRNCISVGDGNYNFFTSGQRIVERNCNSGFVWKPNREPPFFELGNVTWLNGEPNCGFDGESCTVVKKSYLNDVPCYASFCSICQIR
jgi:hypothetical protein